MRAAVVGSRPDETPLTVKDVPRPRAVGDWAVVALKRASLNRLDAMMLEDRASLPLGTILGSDGAGLVHELGPDVLPDAGVAVGDGVIVSPSLGWGPDDRFPSESYEILGSPTHGTHAQFVTVPAANLYAKPPHLRWEEAAALPMAGLTAWRALVTRGRLVPGETVLVGAASSGVGSAAIQIAAAAGARVVAVTSSEDKAHHAVALGATSAVDRTRGDFVEELLRLSGGGADLAIDPTGALWQHFVDALRPAGRLVVVGKMATHVADLRVPSVYWKQIDILGSSMGSPGDFAGLLGSVAAHGWAPRVDSVYPLSQIGAAYARLDSSERIGKVVLDLVALS
jgi:NADPH:quinone reductase-like Zn-dependent oxidoreductase